MLKHTFDLKKNYRYVVYMRMSSEQQNPRSPDQQLDEVNRRLKALGCNWTIVQEYRDEGISGRYTRKRAAYQRMLQDIKSGAKVVDLILVDTLERFGRVDELPTIRKELYEKHGVLVLTADSNFADPNTIAGRALGMIEAMRASEDGRVKAHNVLRGKRDAILQKHWPGGPAPFGYKLKSIMKTANGREEVDHCVLIPDPKTSWIIQLVFALAASHGWGGIRLAKALKMNSDVPDEFRAIPATTLSFWLDNRIYCGEMVWARNSTGIIDDTRVREPNAEADIVRVSDFCEPIVSRECWERVQQIRQARSERSLAARNAKSINNGKQIVIPAPGLALTYPLSGLVFCGSCGVRMRCSSGSPYTTKAGDTQRYTSYVCPRYLTGHCNNGKHIPEQWLRETVISQLSKRYFPIS